MDARESQIFTAIIIAAAVLVFIISSFIYSTIKQHKKVLSIQRKNASAEITSLEKDRARIAEDLHDDLAPMISAVKMNVNSFDLTDESDKMHLQKVNKTIDDIAERMRAISFDLMPTSLQTKGLISALQEFVAFVNVKNNLNIKLNIIGGIGYVDEQYAINIYRMIQEIIHNTIKHSKASVLTINIEKKSGKIKVTTVDNGVGFDHQKAFIENTGFGLRSLQNRISLMQGDFSLDSEEGKGTAYTFEIPIKNE